MAKPKANILIVDNSLDILEILGRILSSQGYEVNTARSGGGALEKVKERFPDLILLDIEMPGIKGYDVCEQLKADPETADIPIIFISAMEEVMNIIRAFKVGGADYITKPFHVEEVLARVDTHLRLARLVKTLEETNEELEYEIDRRKAYEKELEKLAITDPLTRTYNRRFFFDTAKEEINRATRLNQSLSLIMIDIDHFKKVNDAHGHLVGDQVLLNMINLCKSKIREIDVLARFGGDEFMILMPNADLEAAQKTAERLRQSVFESFMATGRSNVLISISLGVTEFQEGEQIDQLVERADQALYQAKEQGRNKVFVLR